MDYISKKGLAGRGWFVFAICLFLAIVVVMTQRVVFADTEPNDTFATASPLAVGLDNAEINASISPVQNVDYYSFTITADATVVIETFDVMQPASDATGLYLYDSAEVLLASDSEGKNSSGHANARIVYSFEDAGIYFIKVQHGRWPWTGDYSIRILPKYDESGAAWDADNGNEPNDVKELSLPIEVGLTKAISSTLFNNSDLASYKSDIDFYYFTAELSQTYVIETFGVETTYNDATGLQIYDDQGNLVADDRFGDLGSGQSNAQAIFTATSAGTHYIAVNVAANLFSWSGGYSLRVLPSHESAFAAWETVDVHEPNDVRELAFPVQVGLSNSITSSLFFDPALANNDRDIDYFYFDAISGTTYVIQTANIMQFPDNATGLQLFDSAGNLLAEDRFGLNGNGHANASVTFTAPSSGSYYVAITIDSELFTWSGTYTLRILPKYDEAGASWDSSNEPNGVPELATELTIGLDSFVKSTLFPNSNLASVNKDVDYYYFTVASAGKIGIETFDVTRPWPEATSRTGIYLYDAAGNLLADDAMGNADYGEIDARIAYTLPSAGTYFIKVMHDTDVFSWTGDYSLRVCHPACSFSVYMPFVARP